LNEICSAVSEISSRQIVSMDKQTDGQCDSSIPSKLCGGYNNLIIKECILGSSKPKLGKRSFYKWYKLFSKIMTITTKVLFILTKWIILTVQILIFHSIFHKMADKVTKMCMDIYRKLDVSSMPRMPPALNQSFKANFKGDSCQKSIDRNFNLIKVREWKLKISYFLVISRGITLSKINGP
jgi:hypothetical protein